MQERINKIITIKKVCVECKQKTNTLWGHGLCTKCRDKNEQKLRELGSGFGRQDQQNYRYR